MKKRYILFTLLSSFGLSSYAQQNTPCATDYYYNQQKLADPTVKQREIEFNEFAEHFHPSTKRAATIIIPVVFHVFHNGGSENISRAQILDQLRILNLDFRRQNADTNKTRPIFKGVAADCNIEFRLATKDPNGNCSEGIVRMQSNLTDNANNAIKNLSVWPSDKYFNIWVVKSINSADIPGGGIILGYAQFPFSGDYRTDGVIIRSDVIGTIGTASSGLGQRSAGRTLTHEAGHWLSLFHTFQDSCKGGDKVDDTPPVMQASYGACLPSQVNTCHNDNPDLPDQYENYMDYSDGVCLNMFTLGQKTRMLANIEKYRFALYSPSNLAATGTATIVTPNCAPVAFFKSNTNTACAGNSVTYNNLSYNASGTLTYEWHFEGGTPETSTSANPSVNYAEPGTYDVTLITTGSKGIDTVTIKDYITVLPSAASAPNFLYEDFENGQYLIHNWQWNSNNLFNWTQTTKASVSGNTSLMVPNYGAFRDNIYNLISPTVSLSNASPVLSFYYSFMQRDVLGQAGVGTSDQLRVYSSTDCGATWQSRWVQSGNNLSTTSGYSKLPNVSFVPVEIASWKGVSVNLSSISGANRNNVRIKFEFTSNGGNNIYLDNVNIGYGLGVSSVNAGTNSVVIYPNPATGSVNLAYTPAKTQSPVSIILTDITGKQVKTLYNGVTTSDVLELNNLSLEGLGAGMYFITVNENGVSSTQKLLVNE